MKKCLFWSNLSYTWYGIASAEMCFASLFQFELDFICTSFTQRSLSPARHFDESHEMYLQAAAVVRRKTIQRIHPLHGKLDCFRQNSSNSQLFITIVFLQWSVYVHAENDTMMFMSTTYNLINRFFTFHLFYCTESMAITVFKNSFCTKEEA